MVRWHHQPNGHESEQTLVVEDRGAWRAAVPGVQRVRHDLASIATTTAKRRLFFNFLVFTNIIVIIILVCVSWYLYARV